ncbi:MAG: metal ABC transporter solute-binding protein, Zn/Mn family [Synergistales bacterium]
MKRLFLLLLLVCLPTIFVGFVLHRPVSAGPVKVFVSIPPQKYFAERVGGNRVQVSVLIPPGADPHTFEPRPAVMVELSRARAWFTIGVPFEDNLLPRVSSMNPELAIVRTEEGIARVESAHEGADPHIWLSPRLVKRQAENILAGLVRADPAGEKVYRSNARRFQAELDALGREFGTLFASVRDKSFLVFHPSWGYLAADYGLRQMAIEVEGKEPKGEDLSRIIESARGKRIRVIFVEPQFSSRAAATIAESIGAKVVTADPLAANWADNLRKVARGFSQAAR